MLTPQKPSQKKHRGEVSSPRSLSQQYLPPPAFRTLKDWLETGYIYSYDSLLLFL